MVKQKRAARTRHTLLQAAATQFSYNGYTGTSLTKISKTAGLSLGAVTFHFPTKAALAEAVQNEGHTHIKTALQQLETPTKTPIQHLTELTLELARLIKQEHTVRALLRLQREHPTNTPWTQTWQPTANKLLHHAYNNGDLHPYAHPDTMTSLITHLITATETLHHTTTTTNPHKNTTNPLTPIWQLLITATTTTNPTDGTTA
ncbi:TetR/AcrR family transcriptional regulator [Streptomyces sp. NBC_01754]|uniref:TetR/AcrR family transcriptional regulator n=1 Tax=Streptomyces sp. NBC_01754 TaxID=2975930 RepID=UPI002DDBBDEF|nr:TetR/AcrR family transcriptional regulator [Streptomyces sp. NBC_01754]WSC96536.1 TetR/AcrR family transcriptional regulator [Streptomyces sp. NBC_01754]